MSSECKIVKGISLFLVLIGIVAIAVAAIMFVFAPDAEALMEDGAIMARVSGAVLAVAGVFEVVAGLLGVRGANNPAHLKAFIVMATVLCFVNLFEVAMVFMGGEGPVWVNLLYAAVAASGIIYASRAQKKDATL